MIDDIDLAAYLKRLRSRVKDDFSILKDTLTLISDACVAPDGAHSDALQIAKTMLEIAYPERVGQIRFTTCLKCGVDLASESSMKQGSCLDCRIKGES